MTASLSDQLTMLLDVLLALVLGFAIGVERKLRYKAAGIRTHAIVSAGAALMLVVGKYGFPESDSDGSRIAAQIVTGVGFLGAGLIMYRHDSLRGITTAAGIWMTAGIGMAAGAGLWWLAIGVSVVVIVSQCVLHLPLALFRTKRFYIYKVKFVCEDDEDNVTGSDKIKSFFDISGYSRINYYNANDSLTALAEISTSRLLTDDDIRRLMLANKFIISIERIYQLDAKE